MGIKRISYSLLAVLFLAQESQWINDKIYSAWMIEKQDLQHSNLNSWHECDVYIPPKTLVSNAILFIAK